MKRYERYRGTCWTEDWGDVLWQPPMRRGWGILALTGGVMLLTAVALVHHPGRQEVIPPQAALFAGEWLVRSLGFLLAALVTFALGRIPLVVPVLIWEAAVIWLALLQVVQLQTAGRLGAMFLLLLLRIYFLFRLCLAAAVASWEVTKRRLGRSDYLLRPNKLPGGSVCKLALYSVLAALLETLIL